MAKSNSSTETEERSSGRNPTPVEAYAALQSYKNLCKQGKKDLAGRIVVGYGAKSTFMKTIMDDPERAKRFKTFAKQAKAKLSPVPSR